MKELKFDFNNSLVKLKGEDLIINIKDDEKYKTFIKDFLSSLQEKFYNYNFIITGKNRIITKNGIFYNENENNIKENQEVNLIGRISNIDMIFKNDRYYYDILVDNINDNHSLKVFYISKEKKQLNINDYIIYKGIVSRIEKKEYENQLNFKKLIIRTTDIEKISKEDIYNFVLESYSRRPLCISSSLGNGFIDQYKLKDIDYIVKDYCITDNNTLNYVMDNTNRPLGFKCFTKINNKYYSIYLYINKEDSTIKFNNKDILVNEAIKTINSFITNSTEMYDGYYVVNFDDILKNKELFKIGSMDSNGIIFQSLLDGDFDLVETYIGIFNILAIEPISNLEHLCKECRKNSSIENLIKINKLIYALSYKYHLPIVFNDNAMVINKEDREIALDFIISEKIKSENINIKNRDDFCIEERKKFDIGKIGYIWKYKEILKELRQQGFNETDIRYMMFCEMLLFETLKKRNEITIIPNELLVDDNKEDKDLLKKMIKKGIKEKGLDISKVKERVMKETDIILKNNYQKIFIGASTVVKRNKEIGYVTGDRGTAGCMLICYILGISNTNPLDYGLDYRMFLGPNCEKVPDIDINISNDIVKDKSEEIMKYFKNTMKASISNFFKEKSIKSQIFTKTIPNFDINYGCSFLNRKLSRIQPHNSGIMLLPNIDSNYIFPTITYGEDKIRIPLYPYEYLEKHIPKLDILSKTDMDILKKLNDYKNIDEISLDLKEVYQYILNNSDEISELNTDYAKSIIKLIKPKSFNDLVIIQGLLHGKGILSSAKNCLNNNLKAIACREDLVEILESYNVKNSFMIMENIRKGNYNKLSEDDLEEIKKLPNEYQKALEQIQYLFPKSHAISYAKQAYYTAFYEINKDEILKFSNKVDIPDGLEDILEEVFE